MFERIVIEADASDASRSLFRMLVDDHLIGKGLTVAQVRLLLGEMLNRSNARRTRERTATARA
jgi:hypothetical protein